MVRFATRELGVAVRPVLLTTSGAPQRSRRDRRLDRRESLLVAIPAVVLVTVALAQVGLARQGLLTPWKGGGFGMFAASDGIGNRGLEILVEAPGRREQLVPPKELRKVVAKALAMPDDRRLRRLADALLELERREGRRADAVSIEVWRTTYSVHNLAPIAEVLATGRFESSEGPAAPSV